MRAAHVERLQSDPVYRDDLEPPQRGRGQVVVATRAAAVNVIDLVIAAGGLPTPPSPFPYIPGREGTGEVISDGAWRGKRVWFEARGGLGGHGAMADRASAEEDLLVELPPQLDDVVAARYGIAGTAAWLALTYRGALQPGETVLVLGASGAVGQIAVQAARVLGAGRVVAAARGDEATLANLAARLGADGAVSLSAGGPPMLPDEHTETETLSRRLRDACGGAADIVIDPLWGPPAMAALACTRDGSRLVQMGSSASATAQLTGYQLRSQTYRPDAIIGSSVSILGHTNMAVPPVHRAQAYRELIAYVAAGEIDVPAETYPLTEVGEAFGKQATSPHQKIVIEL
jgi:NADPH2:quinone reductase